jgi:hypothetical protein
MDAPKNTVRTLPCPAELAAPLHRRISNASLPRDLESGLLAAIDHTAIRMGLEKEPPIILVPPHEAGERFLVAQLESVVADALDLALYREAWAGLALLAQLADEDAQEAREEAQNWRGLLMACGAWGALLLLAVLVVVVL